MDNIIDELRKADDEGMLQHVSISPDGYSIVITGIPISVMDAHQDNIAALTNGNMAALLAHIVTEGSVRVNRKGPASAKNNRQ